MFSTGMTGSAVGQRNVRFRMYLVVFMAIVALGSVLYWRAQAFVAADYVELPQHATLAKKVKDAAKAAPSHTNQPLLEKK